MNRQKPKDSNAPDDYYLNDYFSYRDYYFCLHSMYFSHGAHVHVCRLHIKYKVE